MVALVTATGGDTFFGRTAKLVESAGAVSHFQKAVLAIGDYLIYLSLALVSLLVLVQLFRHAPLFELVQFALILTVASIPVAMPAVLSVTMAVGALALSRMKAIVSRLQSIEEMAGIDILCSDKTGTLTQNRLTLGEPMVFAAADAQDLVLAAALASKAEDNDAIDLAIIGGLNDQSALEGYGQTRFVPFDPVSKRTEASVRSPDGGTFKVSKGAPQVILGLVPNAADVQPQVDKAVQAFASRGYRSLGVARSDAEGPWQFVGVLPLYDPPRADSKATLETAKQMGIDVKMVTGDQVAIAKEIARQLDLGTNILEAGRVSQDKAIESSDGFAQVFPEHKYHIVEVLQKEGHIVGMTGDGVNDAPALKEADAGIAVSGATDAARSAADIVLLTPGLSVIIDAVKESRKIFQRMTSYSIYRIAETVRVLLFMTLSILVFNFYPVTAVMIVLLALLNDGAILSIAYDRVHYSDEPEAWDMPRVLGIATMLGIAGVVASFGMFYIGERVLHLDRATVQSLMYLKLSVAGHLTIFLTRTRGHFWSIRPAPILVGAVLGTQAVATLIATLGLFMAPIGWKLALFVWGYALAWFLVNDWIKLAAERIFDREQPGLLSKIQRRAVRS